MNVRILLEQDSVDTLYHSTLPDAALVVFRNGLQIEGSPQQLRQLAHAFTSVAEEAERKAEAKKSWDDALPAADAMRALAAAGALVKCPKCLDTGVVYSGPGPEPEQEPCDCDTAPGRCQCEKTVIAGIPTTVRCVTCPLHGDEDIVGVTNAF